VSNEARLILFLRYIYNRDLRRDKIAELRKDPVIARWVIISTERGKKPLHFTVEKPRPSKEKKCPFCEGNETLTPPEIISYRKKGTRPNTPGWRIRVVPNKYPALKIGSDSNKREKGIYRMMSGIGAHEVIIETPHHIEDIFSLEDKVVEEVLWVYRERIIELMKNPHFQYVLIFKNRGIVAGASLSHSHSQLIATPLVPKRVEEELEGSKEYFELKGGCLFCHIIEQEIAFKERLLWEDENFISLCPFASCFPYEMCILPKRHCSDFREIKKSEIKSLARILKKCITSLDKILPHVPYNYIIHTSPSSRPNLEFYHWHLEIIPRLTKVAGFEWGTGFYINYITPEEAAKYLTQLHSSPISLR